MTGYTASEIAAAIEAKTGVKIKLTTVKKRLEYADIKPLTKEALYPMDALEIVLNFRGPGRPTKKDEK
jgi:hypothetical protein